MKTPDHPGARLWDKAKQLIPGGGQLLSKKPENFLPGLWPAYYSRAKGCEVWDLEEKHYYDFACLGVGTCVLGYADDDVNAAVHAAVDAGSMCTLNCPEEVELAERLVALHPWADMARFARTGGEACAIAIRIARAATGKDKIAFCGYHGWSDWYIATNLADESNLDGQLLPGLDPTGVPRGLKGTALPFNYNKLDELEAIVAQHGEDLGVIIMEPCRYQDPHPGFLEGVRAIADRLGAVLIFDEVTSGFRQNLGGFHLLTGVDPDIAVFGKALGNGYPISAVIGRHAIMDAAQNTFISSTLWTERIGYVAALATLNKMEKYDVPRHLTAWGETLNAGWKALSDSTGMPLHSKGIPALTVISFDAGDPLAAQTFYAQEMLKAGYLVCPAVYTCYAYTDEIVDTFLRDSEPVFAALKKHVEENTLDAAIPYGARHGGFKRLS
jgi:glutamate-1-semialdehyde 2,1-aminomutase